MLNRSILHSRYIFCGRLVLDTALHIGGGRESSTVTDSPILRDSLGRPLIPGSSFKGAFRAGVERLVPNLPGFRTCQLIAIPKDQNTNDSVKCLSVRKDLAEDYGLIKEAAAQGNALGVGNDATARAELGLLERLNRSEWRGKPLTEEHLLNLLDECLCDTCKVFGSIELASTAHFHDLPVIEPWAETTQIRDGVGIDRDSERAIDQIKFDYEVVPAQTAFEFRLTLENPSDRDLGLVALGLQEFINGMIPLGGIRSRGLGRCHLEDTQLTVIDFTEPAVLRAYLTQKDWLDTAAQPLGDFIERQIAVLLHA
jgi:CRISPR/Cas system CSM-associated protein Csm3 (group 7 of RAMP superfamily)